MQKKLNKYDFEQLAEFRYQLRIFLRFSEEITQQHGITVLQYLLLLQIKGYPGRDWANIAELAERLQSHHHGVVTLVNRCEKAGLVTRRLSQIDKRRVEILLSKKGDQLVNQIAELHQDQVGRLKHVLGRVFEADSVRD